MRVRWHHCLVRDDDASANDLNFMFRNLRGAFREHRVQTLVFPLRVNLTQDFWNKVLQSRHGFTKVFGFGNAVANLKVAEHGAEITSEVLFCGCNEGGCPFVWRLRICLPDNDQGHRAVTFGIHLEIAGGHGSGAPSCYVPYDWTTFIRGFRLARILQHGVRHGRPGKLLSASHLGRLRTDGGYAMHAHTVPT